MKKTCGVCKHYISCEGADEKWEIARYCDIDWGYCQADVPLYVYNVNDNTVKENMKAKHCDTFKRKSKMLTTNK